MENINNDIIYNKHDVIIINNSFSDKIATPSKTIIKEVLSLFLDMVIPDMLSYLILVTGCIMVYLY